ncbi:branched-chain amino acid ABC transporter permease [uncultured Enterovirga sp.]|uniref:branched-chain amino acid ABC transporter permease n=1 Tax=uncultured Enterovirga sp. TaxID=2026352 RepID=UPI0035CC070F
MPATAWSSRRGSSLPPVLRFLVAPALAAAAGCAILVDADQARICRVALPAIEPAGTRIALRRVRAAEAGLRIDYDAIPTDGGTLARHATCRFGPAKDLVGITTDRGEVEGSRIFLLKRYYVDTPEGIAADPGEPPPGANVPEVPAWLAHLLQHLLLGLPAAAIYGLLAAAYGLLFGLVGRIHLAFGEIAAIGAAAIGLVAAAIAAGGPGLLVPGLLAGLLVALAASALHNFVAGHAAFVLVPAGRAQASLIATLGLSLALSEYLRLVGGTTPDWIPPFGAEPIALARAGTFLVTVTPATLLTGGVGAGAALALVLYLRRSRFGRMWRAGADDMLAAALCGIDGRRLVVATLLLSGALAGLAGALVAIRFGALGFAGGFPLGLKALAAAILGGIGSVPGALLGGIAIGAFETLWSAYLPIAWRDLALYAVLIAAIILRSEGATGASLRKP